MFIDYTKVELIAGKGGRGAVSFRREKFVPKGGPDGGDGGRGGHIIFKTDDNLRTLQDIRYRKMYKAENGKPGGKNNRSGKFGEDVIILVPLGTIIRKVVGSEIIADLTLPREECIACRGGIGGKGNSRFKTSTNQTPRRHQTGIEGESGHFEIELKVLADVGLVGFPNAGKSTLLARLSSAKPKIAGYPFTTLEPYLGIIKYEEYKSFVMADIPGLIEGASTGKGLGHQFLKHIERNRVLLYLIDALDENPANSFDVLKQELINFNQDLMLKPFLICRSKIDTIQKDNSDDYWSNFKHPYIDISSVTSSGLNRLMHKITSIIQNEI
ncbi:MAG: GTPase ObgE [Candidatus Marinimicrobia bacterium]|jgi:GTP-binding protein|nr:GTPase ObgE [Candidatus Neomarinimicrobiota bacterium]MBT3937089.1 GTPase ObgE [Candidatus Neomarinimicrobiota bacterium]MBT3962059.1 GTPase ObgE [Candidatus Neomarinimicrobiota bacterium]MBT4382427.1 GTPase ObgE [Candidatus Neomarinimicrobiota bacterium]MBT4636544.1 GTPase ObgE [Candidatus Neomarinimicrobiota bacterium]